jgi:hypothetical protein
MEFASGTGTQSSAQNNSRARAVEQSSNSNMPVWGAAANVASTSSWGATDGVLDGSWPTAGAKPVTTAEVIRTLKEVQDQFRDDLLHFGFNSERCKKVQWYLDHAMQLQTGVENGMLTAQEAMNDISTIKAWSRDDAYRQYQNQAKARYVDETLRPRKAMRRSEEDVRHTEVSDDSADGSRTPSNSLYRPYGYDSADASSPSGTSTTSYHMNSPPPPVYAPTDGTETESYDLSNVTRSSGSERDEPGSDDGSATGSPAH